MNLSQERPSNVPSDVCISRKPGMRVGSHFRHPCALCYTVLDINSDSHLHLHNRMVIEKKLKQAWEWAASVGKIP